MNTLVMMADDSDLYQVAFNTTFVHELFKSKNEPLIFDLIFRKKLNINVTHITKERAIDICDSQLKEKILYIMDSINIPDKPYSLKSRVKKDTFFGWVNRYLIYDSDESMIQRFKQEKHIPLKPRELIPVGQIEDIKGKFADVDNEKTFFLYFTFEGKKHEYEVETKEAMDLWVSVLSLGQAWATYRQKFLSNDEFGNSLGGQESRRILLEKGYIAKNIATKMYDTEKSKNLYLVASKIKKRVKVLQNIRKNSYEKKIQQEAGKVTIKDFDILKIIGKGAFGRVYKVRYKKDNIILAMKVLSKRNLIKKNQAKYALIEKKVLQENSSNNFLLTLHFAFQSNSNLFMVIDYCPNSDLTILLAQNNEEGLEEYVVRFYAAEILLALEDLHNRNILYRDLKPDNVLLDEDGHARLADFGLAAEKIKNNSTFAKSFCGSPIYLSPEILKRRKTNKISDYYTYGVVVYELLTGEPPFYCDDLDGLYRLIKKGNLKFPPERNFSPEIKDLISQLMSNNPKKRLGFVKGIKDIKGHPFFAQMDWVKLKKREIRPPYRFEHDDTMTDSILMIHDRQTKWKDSQMFNDFEFIHPKYL